MLLRTRLTISLFFFSTLNIFSLFAQSGKIEGIVIDSQGKPIPNLQAMLLNTVLGDVSDENGYFCIENIESGIYTLKLDHISFKKKIIEGIEIGQNQTINLSKIALEHGIIDMEGVVVTATRTGRNRYEVSQSINLVPEDRIKERNAKTTAEVLREEPGVFVQKTNHGGGSAIIRGLSSNQILIMVDGIRLNNSTYRLGNHQYLTTIDDNVIDQLEVVRGPTSVLYGSDALGGTINAVTKIPTIQNTTLKANFRLLTRYASADDEKTVRGEFFLKNSKFVLLTGFSRKDYGDMRRGGNSRYPQLENSTDGLNQHPSGFKAYDFDAKLVYNLTSSQNLILAYQACRQDEVPRYDKYENNGYARWLYHPQVRNLVYLTYENSVQNGIITSFKASLSYQQQKEGREIQKETTNPRTRESDDVRTAGFTLQMNSTFGGHLLTYGMDVYFDEVGSERQTIDPTTGSVEVDPQARYPNGAEYDSYGFYLQDEIRISPRWTMIPGIRYSYFTTRFSILNSDNQTLSSDDISQSFRSFTGNLGVIYKLTGRTYLNMNVGQAFRAPNLSDISKLGESKGNVYEVPNPDLTPEKMLSVDAGFKLDFDRVKADVSAFYSTISDLLASADATYQGASTIERNDVIYKVKTKQNIGNAFIRGIEAGIHVQCHDYLFLRSNVSWAYGHNLIHDEPVGGIPPLFGLVGLKWQKPTYHFDMFMRFARKQNRLSADDMDDPRIPDGGTPGWYTINFRMGMHVKNIGILRFAVENILDYNYREHGSGINGPGRNFIVSFEVKR